MDGALDGLGRALWWLREPEQAVVHRERAYAGFRRDGQLARAARIALWLSREYALVWGNDGGRERLARAAPSGCSRRRAGRRARRGSSSPARSAPRPARRRTWPRRRSTSPSRPATSTSSFARSPSSASPRSRRARSTTGLAQLDEAMAAATGGEPATLETFADVSCTLMLACERADDAERPKQWSRCSRTFVRKYDHVALLAFCRTCCADVYAANGASTPPRRSSWRRCAS